MPNAQLITESTQVLLHSKSVLHQCSSLCEVSELDTLVGHTAQLVMDANALKQHTRTLVSQLEAIDPFPCHSQSEEPKHHRQPVDDPHVNHLATQINALTIFKEEMSSWSDYQTFMAIFNQCPEDKRPLLGEMTKEALGKVKALYLGGSREF
jgi:hypothetical protein